MSSVAPPPDLTGRLALTVPEFAAAIGVSRAKAYEMLKVGEIPTIVLGGCRRVRVADARSWLDAQPIAPVGGAA